MMQQDRRMQNRMMHQDRRMQQNKKMQYIGSWTEGRSIEGCQTERYRTVGDRTEGFRRTVGCKTEGFRRKEGYRTEGFRRTERYRTEQEFVSTSVVNPPHLVI